jgi:hypothetical protein
MSHQIATGLPQRAGDVRAWFLHNILLANGLAETFRWNVSALGRPPSPRGVLPKC